MGGAAGVDAGATGVGGDGAVGGGAVEGLARQSAQCDQGDSDTERSAQRLGAGGESFALWDGEGQVVGGASAGVVAGEEGWGGGQVGGDDLFRASGADGEVGQRIVTAAAPAQHDDEAVGLEGCGGAELNIGALDVVATTEQRGAPAGGGDLAERVKVLAPTPC